MGRQLRAYLLPTDIEAIMCRLAESGDLQIFREVTEDPRELLQQSPFVQSYLLRGGSSVRCFLAPRSGDVTYRYLEKRKVWRVNDESEVIKLHGFDFNRELLLQGRLYYQTDYVKDRSIVTKSPAFIRWAERVFRLLKKELAYSAKLQAYIGEAARAFVDHGGRLTAMIYPNVEPVYEVP